MMKKMLILAAVLLAVALPAMAEDFGRGRDMGSGKTKVGGIVGDGLTATIGFDNGKSGEFNIFAGYDYGYSGFNMVQGGVNYLFTLANIDFGGQIFPLSLGPQVSIGYWWDPFNYFGLSDFNGLYTEALAMLRWEYTFWFPMNVFVEFGAGLGIQFGETYSSSETMHLGFAYSAGIGVRYVIGQD